MAKTVSYRDAGVDIDEADRAVGAIRKMARATFTKGVLTEIGSFGACFALPKMRRPVLVSSVDGVGTKLKIAFATGRHDTVGEDLVNHCVNSRLSCGWQTRSGSSRPGGFRNRARMFGQRLRPDRR